AITTALTVTEMPDNWIQLTGVWISGENPVKTATIEIVNTKTGANGNDIMLDDISFIGCSPEISIYAGADISMCNGSSVELHADITTPDGGDYTISWSPPTGLSSTTIANPICTSTKTRTYTAIATFSDGTSCSATDQVKVSVAANPTASITVSGPLTVCVGSCVSLSTTAVSGSSYRWLLNGADAPGTNTGASYSACSTGNYALLVTNAAGCSQLSNTVYAQVITCKEGEDLFATSDMSLYPNPANNNITMNYVSQNNAAARVRFLGISGAVVYEMNYEMKGGINDLLMDISMLEAGIYIAEIQSGSNVSFGKFVKM
ncbi:MAG: T9SS type A sorting domain-containing protein, partial [Chitinophagales bacterium]